MKKSVDEILRLLTLHFQDGELEKSFRKDYFERSLDHIRVAMLLATAVYGLFGILDDAIIPDVRGQAWIIRYIIFCPLTLVVFALSYVPSFHRFLWVSILALGFVGGAGIIVMIALAAPPGSDLYYVGLLLCCFFYYTFLRLRFLQATILSWTIFLLYEITAIWIKGMPSALFINNSFFFISFNVTGMWACYTMERYARQDFLQRNTILNQTEKMRLIIENSPMGILHFDSLGVITECNSSFVELIGSSRERMIGMNIIRDVDIDNCGLTFAAKTALEGHRAHFEGDYAPPVGAKKTVTVSSDFAPIVGGEGKIEGGIGIVEDISERQRAVAALAESEAKYKDLFENANDMIYTQDLHGSYTSANTGVTRILGYTEQEFVHLDFRDIVHPDYLSVTEENFWKKVRDGIDVTGPYEILVWSKDRTPVWLEILSRLVRRNEEPVGIHGIARDISERKRFEQALKASEEKYRTVLQSSPNPIVVYDQSGLVTYVNPAFEKTFEWDQQELVGKTINYVPEEENPQAVRTMNLLYQGIDVPSFDTRRLTKKGKILDIQINAALLTDAQGLPAGSVVTLFDITERKLMEKALRSSEEGKRLLIEESPIGIGIIQDTKYAYVNPALLKIMGCHELEELVDQPFQVFMAHGDGDFIQLIDETRPDGQAHRESYQVKAIRGNGEYVDLSVWPKRSDYLGKPAIFAFILDVTEENTLKSQLMHAQKMEAIGILAGGVAHDFNNLLQVVLGYAQLLLTRATPDSREYDSLTKIHSAALRGAKLVKELLTFGRKTEMRPCPLDINHEIREITVLLEGTIPKMISIELMLAEDPSIVVADPTQVEQILMNLALNAKDAMPDGGKMLIQTENVALEESYCRTHLGARPGNYLMISVSDTGHGMAQEELEHIFEPFYTTKDVGKGTGLGLSMVYGIVKQHSGYISCESQPGAGTTFRVYLPAVEREENRTNRLVWKPDNGGPKGGTETILMVDDEDMVLAMGSDSLRQEGYSVLTASNGQDALDIFQEHRDRLALVTLDLIMPEMGGKKCLQELLRIDPRARVLIVSGQADENIVRDVMELGASGFVKKPYQLNELLSKMREIIDAR